MELGGEAAGLPWVEEGLVRSLVLSSFCSCCIFIPYVDGDAASLLDSSSCGLPPATLLYSLDDLVCSHCQEEFHASQNPDYSYRY